MDAFTIIAPKDAQNTPREVQMGKQLNRHYNTQELLSNGLFKFSVYCKYSMKEYTMKIHLYFNKYYLIYNFYKQINMTKAKINAYLLNLALSQLKQLKIKN